MFRTIDRIVLSAALTIITMLIVIYGGDLFVLRKRINSEQYLSPTAKPRSSIRKSNTEQAQIRLYQQKIGMHVSIADQIISRKLDNLNNSHVLIYELHSDFARMLSRWPTAHQDISTGVWFKTIYYIYSEGVCDKYVYSPQISSIVPVIIVELKLGREDAPHHTQVHEGNGEEFVNEVIINKGFEKTGFANAEWIICSKAQVKNISGLRAFAEKRFHLDWLRKIY